MSAASAKARALLAAATQGRWEPSPKACDAIIGIDAPEPDQGHIGYYGGRPLGESMQSADRALIAEACSPSGGLLAQLAGEVELLENDPRPALARLKARQGGPGPSVWATFVAEFARLRAALEAARLVGHGLGQKDGSIVGCGVGAGLPCTCGADAHNAAIDAALRGQA